MKAAFLMYFCSPSLGWISKSWCPSQHGAFRSDFWRLMSSFPTWRLNVNWPSLRPGSSNFATVGHVKKSGDFLGVGELLVVDIPDSRCDCGHNDWSDGDFLLKAMIYVGVLHLWTRQSHQSQTSWIGCPSNNILMFFWRYTSERSHIHLSVQMRAHTWQAWPAIPK